MRSLLTIPCENNIRSSNPLHNPKRMGEKKSMKKNMLGKVIASALVTAVVTTTAASAAPVEKKPTQGTASVEARNVLANPVVNATLSVDGIKSVVKSIKSGSQVLYAASDLANSLGASYISSGSSATLLNEFHTAEIFASSAEFKANGKEAKFVTAPQTVQGVLYVELPAIVDALGGEIDGTEVKSVKVLEGIFSAPRLINNAAVIVNKDDADATEIYQLRAANNKNEILSTVDEAASMVVSPDGQYGVYADASAQLILVNLHTGTSHVWSSDNSVKMDLVWTADSKKVYFAQGDKQEKIGVIELSGSSVKSILSDKVENKAEPRVSADGTKMVYTVNVTGVADSDKESTEESLKIDYSKAGSQLFVLDLTKKDAKPIQLTKALDNKLFANVLNDGRVVYISADPEGKVENDVLKAISADGKNLSDLIADKNVLWSAVTTQDTLVVATEDASGVTIAQVSAQGERKELFKIKAEVSEISVSADGSTIALIADGKVLIVQNGQATTLTK